MTQTLKTHAAGTLIHGVRPAQTAGADECMGAGDASLVRYARPDLERVSALIVAERIAGATLEHLSCSYGISLWAVRQVLAAAGVSGRQGMRGKARTQPTAGTHGPVDPTRYFATTPAPAPSRLSRLAPIKPASPSLPAPSGRPTRRLSAADARRLRGVRILAVRGQGADSPALGGAQRLAELLAMHHNEGVSLSDLAHALGIGTQATATLLSSSGSVDAAI
jgi:hypothetical protein